MDGFSTPFVCIKIHVSFTPRYIFFDLWYSINKIKKYMYIFYEWFVIVNYCTLRSCSASLCTDALSVPLPTIPSRCMQCTRPVYCRSLSNTLSASRCVENVPLSPYAQSAVERPSTKSVFTTLNNCQLIVRGDQLSTRCAQAWSLLHTLPVSTIEIISQNNFFSKHARALTDTNSRLNLCISTTDHKLRGYDDKRSMHDKIANRPREARVHATEWMLLIITFKPRQLRMYWLTIF